MTSKKLNLLWGKQGIDSAVNPFGQVYASALWTTLTLHALWLSQGYKFTALWAVLRPQARTRPRSPLLIIRKVLEKFSETKLSTHMSTARKFKIWKWKRPEWPDNLSRPTIFVVLGFFLSIYPLLMSSVGKQIDRQRWQLHGKTFFGHRVVIVQSHETTISGVLVRVVGPQGPSSYCIQNLPGSDYSVEKLSKLSRGN